MRKKWANDLAHFIDDQRHSAQKHEKQKKLLTRPKP